MSTLTSASSLDDVNAAYDNNASYEEDASVAKAKAFITACRFLIRRLPKAGGKSGATFTLTISEIQAQMQHAQRYVNANDTTGSNGSERYADFRDYRS